MMNFTDFFNIQKEKQTYNGIYRIGEFYKYENSVIETFKKLDKMENNLLYQSELTNILINFYEGIFNIMDKIALEIKNGNNNNQVGFEEFFEFLKQIYFNLLNTSKRNIKTEKLIKKSKLLDLDASPSIENYMKIKNEMNNYIKKLYNIFSKTNDIEIMDFIIEEQKIIMTSFYKGLFEIAKKMKDEMEKGNNNYSGTMYFIMVELDKIIDNISVDDSLLKSNEVIMTYKIDDTIWSE